MYKEDCWPPSHDDAEWDDTLYYASLARWNHECQTEMERWHLFIEAKYEDHPDWSNFELEEEWI